MFHQGLSTKGRKKRENLIDLELIETLRRDTLCMGGLGSGRPARHQLVSHVPFFDLATLTREVNSGRNNGKMTFTLEEGKVFLLFEFRFDQAKIILHYQGVTSFVSLEKTTPQYGGVRYWLISPCCNRRVRALYFLSKIPKCRKCLQLNYPSQRSSPAERSLTYEKYLLSQGRIGAWMEWLRMKNPSLTMQHAQAIYDAASRSRTLAVVARCQYAQARYGPIP